jgi:DNA-binding NtrC family response regulator
VSKRILVVDDEKNIRLMLDQALVTAGYEVVTAIDGEHAIEKVQAGGLDMVLLDMKLPGMDGIEVLRRVRSSHPTLPVVMITAHGTVETAVEAMKLGALDYLRKPFMPEEIRSIVAKVIDRQRISLDQPGETAAQCLDQAKLLLSRRQFQEAEVLLRRTASLDPTDAEALNLLGIAEELKGSLQDAARFYRAALSFAPGYEPAQQNLHRVTQWPYNSKGVEANLESQSGPEAR